MSFQQQQQQQLFLPLPLPLLASALKEWQLIARDRDCVNGSCSLFGLLLLLPLLPFSPRP